MSVNKVEYFGKVLLDLTEDSVTPETLAEGITAHNKSGEKITGTMKASSGSEDLDAELTEQENLISQLSAILDSKASGGGSSGDGSSGGGGGSEICTVEIIANVPVGYTTLYWTDANGNICNQDYEAMDIMMGISLTVLQNSTIYSSTPFFSDMESTSSDGLIPYGDTQCLLVKNSGTFTIS